MRPTEMQDFLSDLNGGVFQEQVEAMLSQVALSVVETGKKGKVQLTFDIEQISEASQVKIAHELKYVQPKKRGSVQETDKSTTPLYVNAGGKMTFFPENQGQLLTKTGQPNTQHQE